jgi:hypothetical protein
MYAFFQRAQGWSEAWPLTNKPVALFICDEKYDCQPGKRDLEDFFGWKSRLIADVTVATPQIDSPPPKQGKLRGCKRHNKETFRQTASLMRELVGI